MYLKKIIDFYYNRHHLRYRFLFDFALVFSVSILLMTACKPLNKPLVVDEKELAISQTIPQDQAKEIVSKYVGRNWAENPYLICQVNHLDPSNYYNTARIEYNVKGDISFMDMVLYPRIGRDECLEVKVNQMKVYEQDKLKITYYQPKLICCNIAAERDELVQALIALGAKIGH